MMNKQPMNDLHIEDFYLDITNTFLQLYSTFPNKKILYIEDLIGYEEADEFGLHSTRHLSCLSALVWLKEQNYINYECLIKQEAIDQAVLTEKSFLILSSQTPDIIALQIDLATTPQTDAKTPLSVTDAHASNIHVLSLCKRSGSSLSLKKTVLELLKQSQYFR